jgi:glycosyltransferase involved in cell wall biosynthesis
VEADLSGPADVTIRHTWPPGQERPAEGRWVIIQPWEYGPMPQSWRDGFGSHADEIWVPSRHVRAGYIASGVPTDRVFVVPNGIDPDVYHPGVEPLALGADCGLRIADCGLRIARGPESGKSQIANRKSQITFLFVGGLLWRKGLDVLLEAWLRAFRADDDVCLILKDQGGSSSLYQADDGAVLIREAQGFPGAADIVYMTDNLDESQMAGLYAAADCLVHPFRGEGFGLPVAEAMACGRPVIVTCGGACDDFCTPDNSFGVRARAVECEPPLPSAQPTWVLEPDVEHLADRLRYVYTHRDEAAAVGQRAAEYVHAHFTWEHAAEVAWRQIQRLADEG